MCIRWLILAPLLIIGLNTTALGQINCQDPEVTAAAKRTVKQNYLELVYDAETGRMEWHRFYRDKLLRGPVTDHPVVILQDSVFPPFAYSRERIIVKVCNAKFEADLSASSSVTPIPESGPDIHGLQQASTASTPSTQTTSVLLASTGAAATASPIDSLVAVQPNGEALAAEYLRSLAAVYDSDFRKITADIKALNCSAVSNPPDCEIGSASYVLNQAQTLRQLVSSRTASQDASTNSGAFELLSARTTNLVSSVTNLSATLSTMAFSDRIAKLLTDSQELAKAIGSATGIAKSREADVNAAQEEKNKAEKELADARSRKQPTKQKEDELAKKEGVLRLAQQKHSAISILAATAAGAERLLESEGPSGLVAKMIQLDDELKTLHHTASEIFDSMNTLHDQSKQVIATVIQPQSSNAVIGVSIVVHDAYSPFGFAASGANKAPTSNNTKDSTPSGTGSDKNSGKSDATKGAPSGPAQQSASSGSEQHVVRRVLIEIHRRAEFNIVGGFSASTLRQRSFGLKAVSASNTNLVVFKSQDDRFQLQPLVGLNMYLRKRDLFPGYLSPAMRWTPGILLATSVSSLGNFMIGPDFEPMNGIDIYGGLHVGRTTDLASGVVPGVTQFDPKTASAPTVQIMRPGLFFGIGFDANVFKSIFQKASSQ